MSKDIAEVSFAFDERQYGAIKAQFNSPVWGAFLIYAIAETPT